MRVPQGLLLESREGAWTGSSGGPSIHWGRLGPPFLVAVPRASSSHPPLVCERWACIWSSPQLTDAPYDKPHRLLGEGAPMGGCLRAR